MINHRKEPAGEVSTRAYWFRCLSRFDAGANWIRNRSLTSFTLLLVALLITRAGLFFMPVTNFDTPGELAGTSWSEAASNLWLVLLKVMAVDSRLGFEAVAVCAFGLSVGVIAWLIHRNQRGVERWLLTTVLLGSLGTVLSGYGRADTFLVLGAVIFAAGSLRNPAYAITGALLIALSNKMQSVAMAVALLLLAVLPEFRRWMKPGLVLLALGGIAVGVDSLLAAETQRESQIDMFPKYLGISFENSLQNAPLLMYALFGVGWIPVVGAMLMLGKGKAVVIGVALVAMPAAVMFTTLDGMRVGVGVSAVPFIVVAMWFFREATAGMTTVVQTRALFALMLVGVLTPAMHVSSGGVSQPLSYIWFSVNFWFDTFVS